MANGKRILSVAVKRMWDSDPDTSYLEQAGFEDRLEQYNDGQFSFIGIRADADVVVDNTVQHITSGGLWGIEDDSTREYLKTIEEEQMAELKGQLLALGFSKRAISKAFKAA